MAQLVKNSPANAGDTRDMSLIPRSDPLEKEMAMHSSILPGKLHGQRSLAGYSPWGCKELDAIKQLTVNKQGCQTHFVNVKIKFNFTDS